MKRFFGNDQYTRFLFAFLIISLFLAGYYIWVVVDVTINFDYAADMLWPKLVFERGLFSTEFFSSTVSFLPNRSFIPAIIAHLMGFDWLGAAKVSVIFNTVFTLFLFSMLLNKLKLSPNLILAACIFMIYANFSSASIIYHRNIYYAQDNFIILIILIFAIDVYQSDNKPRKIAFLMIASLIGGAISIRPVTLVLVPLFALEFIKAAIAIRGQTELPKPLFKGLWMQMKNIILSGAALLIGVIGYVTVTSYAKAQNTFWGNALEFQSFRSILDSFPRVINSTVVLLGFPSEDLRIRSIGEALVVAESLMRATLVIILIIGFIHIIILRENNEKTTRLKYIFYFFSISIPLNFLLLLTSFSEGSGQRHQFFTWYMVAISAVVVIDKDIVKTKIYRWFITLVLIMLCMLSFYNNYVKTVQASRAAKPPQYAVMAWYMLDNGYDVVLARNGEHAHVMGAYTNFELRTAAFTNDFEPHYWLVDKTIFEENEGKYALIFSDAESQDKYLLATLKESNKAKTHLILSQMEYDRSFGRFDIYSLDFNPTLAVHPVLKGIITPASSGIILSNGEIDDDDVFITNGDNGLAFAGPHWQVFNGIFDFVLNYEVIENISGNESVGYFDICIDNENIIRRVELNSTDTKAIISGITFDDPDAIFESRVTVANNAKIKIISIDVTVSD